MTIRSLSIAVCICTYKRPQQLRHLLHGLARQQFKQTTSPELTVIVADNEGNDEARIVCETEQLCQLGRLIYIQEPRRGISHARNACLAHVPSECDFIAMIDDDEFPEPHWLEQLIIVQMATGADVIQGPVHAILPVNTPNWMKQGQFFGWPYYRHRPDEAPWGDRSEIAAAATNNVLVSWQRLRALGLRFDPQLALSGGEDVMFFRQLREAGFRFAFASLAVVSEPVPPERANFKYLCRAEYRDGCLKPAFKQLRNKARNNPLQQLKLWFRNARNGSLHIWNGAYLLIKHGVGCSFSRYLVAIAALKIVHGAGVVAGSFGFRYQHYK